MEILGGKGREWGSGADGVGGVEGRVGGCRVRGTARGGVVRKLGSVSRDQ